MKILTIFPYVVGLSIKLPVFTRAPVFELGLHNNRYNFEEKSQKLKKKYYL